MKANFDESYDMEIHNLISQLLLIQQKRLNKDELYSDESLTNSYLNFPSKGDLMQYVRELRLQMENTLSVLSDE